MRFAYEKRPVFSKSREQGTRANRYPLAESFTETQAADRLRFSRAIPESKAKRDASRQLLLLTQALRSGVITAGALEILEEHVGGRVTRGRQIWIAAYIVRTCRGNLIEPMLIR